MPRVRRCPICRGTLGNPWQPAAPNRIYCSSGCRQEAYRRRAAGIGPAAARRAETARQARVQQATAAVEQLLRQVADDLDGVHDAVDRHSTFLRLSPQVADLAGRVEQLAGAAIGYDRALGATWAELAEDTGVDETTLRRRQHRTQHAPGQHSRGQQEAGYPPD